jgi:hypothetical protein
MESFYSDWSCESMIIQQKLNSLVNFTMHNAAEMHSSLDPPCVWCVQDHTSCQPHCVPWCILSLTCWKRIRTCFNRVWQRIAAHLQFCLVTRDGTVFHAFHKENQHLVSKLLKLHTQISYMWILSWFGNKWNTPCREKENVCYIATTWGLNIHSHILNPTVDQPFVWVE